MADLRPFLVSVLGIHLLVPCMGLLYVALGASDQRLVEPMERRAGLSLSHRLGGLVTQGNVLREWTASHTLSPVVHGAGVKVVGYGPVALLAGSERPRNRVRHEVEVVEDKSCGGVSQQRGGSFDPGWVARVDPLAKHRQAS